MPYTPSKVRVRVTRGHRRAEPAGEVGGRAAERRSGAAAPRAEGSRPEAEAGVGAAAPPSATRVSGPAMPRARATTRRSRPAGRRSRTTLAPSAVSRHSTVPRAGGSRARRQDWGGAPGRRNPRRRLQPEGRGRPPPAQAATSATRRHSGYGASEEQDHRAGRPHCESRGERRRADPAPRRAAAARPDGRRHQQRPRSADGSPRDGEARNTGSCQPQRQFSRLAERRRGATPPGPAPRRRARPGGPRRSSKRTTPRARTTIDQPVHISARTSQRVSRASPSMISRGKRIRCRCAATPAPRRSGFPVRRGRGRGRSPTGPSSGRRSRSER